LHLGTGKVGFTTEHCPKRDIVVGWGVGGGVVGVGVCGKDGRVSGQVTCRRSLTKKKSKKREKYRDKQEYGPNSQIEKHGEEQCFL